jgi:hypothetical protein
MIHLDDAPRMAVQRNRINSRPAVAFSTRTTRPSVVCGESSVRQTVLLDYFVREGWLGGPALPLYADQE